jgi:hypothetical protein
MASEAASYREDVEQSPIRGVSPDACCAIAPAGRVMGDCGEAGAAGWDHRYGAGAGRGPAESSEVDGSLGAARIHKIGPRRGLC